MKRTTIVLSAAALGGLSAAAFAGGTQDAPKTGWPLLLGYHPASLTEAAGGRKSARTPGHRVLASSGICNGLYDNGPHNEVNGYSNFTAGVGPRRGMMDDFVVPNGETWTITDIHHTHVWDTVAPGSGTDLELAIWNDSAGEPFEIVVPAQLTTSYTELATGQTRFERPEAISWATYDPIVLDAGRYWFDAAIAGPENNFWLTADVQFEECWLNWDEFDPPGPQTGTAQFGTASDVTWCLTGTISAGPANQFGLKHNPLGAALLSADAGTLTVSNIGSSGKDGVRVELGNSSGGWLGHTPAAPTSGTMTVTAIGTIDGTPDLGLGNTVASFGASNQIVFNLDGLNATTFTTRRLLDGELVNEFSGLPGGLPAASTTDAIGGGECLPIRMPDNIMYVVRLDAPVMVTGAGMVDEVQMIPDQTTAGIEAITDVSLTIDPDGDGPPEFVLDNGGIVMFGNEHTRTGDASIKTVDGTLQVSNISSSGQDGVTVGVNDAEAFDATIVPVAVNSAPNSIVLSATGCFEATRGTELGNSFIASGSGFTVLKGNYAPISSANTILVELYDDGVFVASVQRNGGQNNFLFANGADPFPLLTGLGSVPVATPGLYFQFDGDLDVRTGTGGSTSIGIGDEIRVLADQPDAPVTAIDSVTIVTNNGPSLVITGETVTNPGIACGGAPLTGACCVAVVCTEETAADCAGMGGAMLSYQGDGIPCDPNPCLPECDPTSGDVTGEGCVSFADVLEVLGAWGGTGDPGIPGDANCDGMVSFADILLILGTWGEGCP